MTPLSRATGDPLPFEDAKDSTGICLHMIAHKLTRLNDKAEDLLGFAFGSAPGMTA